jgi:hypothetical protein
VADSKINQLAAVTSIAPSDEFVLARAGTNNKVSGSVFMSQQTGISGFANSQTTYTSGTVSMSELGAITIRSTTGNQFQFSVNAQSVQPETKTFIGGVGNSEVTYTSGTVNLSGLGNVTVRSTTGQAFQISVPAQSVQAETQTFIAGIQNSETTYSSGSVKLSVVGGNMTIRSTTGQAFQFSMSQSVQAETQTFLGGISNSETTYTSGTVGLSVVGGNMTIRSTTGNAFQFSVSSAAQTVQTQNLVDMTLAGNSTSAGAGYILISSGTMTLAGGNNITLSQIGNAVTISGAAAGGVQTAISGLANSETTYTSGTVSLSVVAGNLTIRSTTGQAFQFSMSQSVQAETQTFLSGIQNSETTYTSGNVKLSELANITIRSTTGNQFQFSVNSQTVQTQNMVAVSATNTLYSSGTVVFTGSNMITVKSSGAGQTIILDATQTNQSAIKGLGVSNTGNTAGNTGISTGVDWVIAGSTNITASQSTVGGGPNTIWLSVPNVGGGAAFSGGMSNLGNTAGNTGVTGTQLVLVGTNMVSLSQTTGANGATLSINATQSVQTQNMFGMALSTTAGGATTGTMGTITSGTITMYAGNNITLSQSGTNTVVISALASSSLSATGQISISTNASTISIGVPNPIASFYGQSGPLLMAATQGIGASAATQTTVTAFVMPVNLGEDLAFNNLHLAVHNSFSSNSTSISSVNYSYSMGASMGFYTLTGSSMSLVTSYSGSLGYTNQTAAAAANMSMTARVGMGGSSTTKSATNAANISSLMSSINSVRLMPLVWTTQSNTLTRGNYWAVVGFSQLTGGANQASLSQVGFVSGLSALGSAFNPPAMMKDTASVTSPYPFIGLATMVNSSNSLMPVSFNTSNITTATATANSTAFQSIWFQMHSSHSN